MEGSFQAPQPRFRLSEDEEDEADQAAKKLEKGVLSLIIILD
jgi:hypothetical protein